MRVFVAAIFSLLLTLAAAQYSEDSPSPPNDPHAAPISVGTELITALFSTDLFQNKINRVYQIIDLKVRFVKLVRALITRENLILLRRLLDFVVRICNFLAGFLPEPMEEPKPSILEVLFPSITLNNPENPVYAERVNREVNLTNEDQELLDNNKDDLMNIVKLIENAP